MSRLLFGCAAVALLVPARVGAQVTAATDVTKEEYMAVRNAPEGASTARQGGGHRPAG